LDVKKLTLASFWKNRCFRQPPHSPEYTGTINFNETDLMWQLEFGLEDFEGDITND